MITRHEREKVESRINNEKSEMEVENYNNRRVVGEVITKKRGISHQFFFSFNFAQLE